MNNLRKELMTELTFLFLPIQREKKSFDGKEEINSLTVHSVRDKYLRVTGPVVGLKVRGQQNGIVGRRETERVIHSELDSEIESKLPLLGKVFLQDVKERRN